MQAEVITEEYLKTVMDEVAKEVASSYPQEWTEEQQQAFNLFFMTLNKITSTIFDWLPPGEANSVITTCGTWFGVGMLFGKSPELLVKILNRVNPSMTSEELPDWLIVRLRGGNLNDQ